MRRLQAPRSRTTTTTIELNRSERQLSHDIQFEKKKKKKISKRAGIQIYHSRDHGHLVRASLAHSQGLHRPLDHRVPVDRGLSDAHGHCASEHLSHEVMAEWIRQGFQQRAEFDPICIRKLAGAENAGCLEPLVGL